LLLNDVEALIYQAGYQAVPILLIVEAAYNFNALI